MKKNLMFPISLLGIFRGATGLSPSLPPAGRIRPPERPHRGYHGQDDRGPSPRRPRRGQGHRERGVPRRPSGSQCEEGSVLPLKNICEIGQCSAIDETSEKTMITELTKKNGNFMQ